MRWLFATRWQCVPPGFPTGTPASLSLPPPAVLDVAALQNGYRRRMARVVTGVVLAAVFISVLVMALMKEARVECEVCIEFGGGRACRTNIASDRDRAINGATSSACVVLSGGVTSRIQCSNTPPRSIRCSA